MRVDVRRLAAVDMWGGAGSLLRRRLILAEFVLGAIGALAVGLPLLLWTGSTLLGAWLVGLGLNYVPLAAYAIAFSPAGALERELDGVDVRTELRHYTVAQIWVVVPGLFVVLAATQGRGGRGPCAL